MDDLVAGLLPYDFSWRVFYHVHPLQTSRLCGGDLNTNGIIRTYKVYGSETLENGGEWQYQTNSLHRFFKVTVEMP